MTSQASVKLANSFGYAVTPAQPTIGAVVEGVDFRNPLSDEARDAIWALLLKHRVLFFHDQDITQEQQVVLGRRFGNLEIHPLLSDVNYPELFALNSAIIRERNPGRRHQNTRWHSDTTFRRDPSAASILRGVTVPQVGGDTVWADAVAAYAGLADDVKARIANLKAVHSATHGFGTYAGYDVDGVAKQYPPVEHPVVRTHPETGEKVLFVNSVFTSHIVGLEKSESDELLHHLWDQFKLPEYQVRLKWKKNTLAFWDNRATQHYGVYNHGDEPRVVERVTINGDVPY